MNYEQKFILKGTIEGIGGVGRGTGLGVGRGTGLGVRRGTGLGVGSGFFLQRQGGAAEQRASSE